MKYLKKFSGEEEYQEYLNNPEELDTPHVGLVDEDTKKLRYQPTCKFGYTIYTPEPQVIDVIPSSFFNLGDGKLSEDLFYNNNNSTLILNFSEPVESGDGGEIGGDKKGENTRGKGDGDYFIELPGFRYWVEEQRAEELSYSLFGGDLFSQYGISTQAFPSFLGFFPSFDNQADFLRELNPMILFHNIRMDYSGEDAANYDVWGYSLGDAAVNQWLVDNNAEEDDEYMNEHFSELINIYYSPVKLAVQNYLSSHTLAQIAAPITIVDGKGNEQEYSKVSPYVISYLGMTQRLHPDWTWSQVVSQCWEMPAPKSLYWTFDTFLADFYEENKFSAYITSLLLTPDETDETYLTSFRYLISLGGIPNLHQYIETQLSNQYTNPDTGELTITLEEFEDLIEPTVDSYIREHFSTSNTLEERKFNVVQVLCEICGAEYVPPVDSPIKTILIDGEEIEIKTELTVSSTGTITVSNTTGGTRSNGGSENSETYYGNALYYFEPGIHEITLITSSFIKEGNYFSGLGNLISFGLLGVKYPHTWNTISLEDLNSINFLKAKTTADESQVDPWSGYDNALYSTGGRSTTTGKGKENSTLTVEIPPSRVEYGENIENLVQVQGEITVSYDSSSEEVSLEDLIDLGGSPASTPSQSVSASGIFDKGIDLVIKDKRYKVDHDHQLVLKGGRLELVYGSSSLIGLPRPTDANFVITSISPTAFPNCKVEVDNYSVPEGITRLETGSLHHICLNDGFILVLPSSITSLEPGIFHPDSSNNGIVIFNSAIPPGGFADFLGESGRLFYVVQNSWQSQNIYANYSNALGLDHPNITLTSDISGAIIALKYLAFDILSPGTITIDYDGSAPTGSGYYLSYCLNGGDWVKLTGTDIINFSLNVEEGDRILWEGNALRGYLYSGSSNFRRSKFNTTCEFEIYGSLSSLMYNQSGKKLTEVPKGGFYELFGNCTGLISAEHLILPKSLNSGGYNFSRMFQGCTSLTVAPEISVNVAEPSSFYYMFYNCAALTSSPNISTTTLKSDSCSYMFSNCIGLEEAGSISVSDTIESGACYYMFNGCTHLEATPEIIADTIASSAFQYKYMFSGCTSLTTVSSITATTVGSYGLRGLCDSIKGSLTSVENITITDAGEYALYELFEGCNNLTDVGDITITNAGEYSFGSMFSNCTSLVSSPKLLITNLASSCCSNMFYGCSSLVQAPTLPATTLASYCYSSMFQNCTSLTTAPVLPATTLVNSCYSGMFQNCTSLTAAPELPATTLSDSCYYGMFRGCTSLTQAPELPATTLAGSCYKTMFSECSSLTTAPELSATTLAENCYQGMFENCTAIEEAPELPATALTNYCYNQMFKGCTSLEECLAISANSSGQYSCANMFEGCTSLTETQPITLGTAGNYVCQYMFKNCTALLRASAISVTTAGAYSFDHMFSGCNLLQSSSSVSIGSLENRTCQYMFENCSSLTTVPTLSSTTLAPYCYFKMFAGCSSLTRSPELPATTLSDSCYYGMFEGCTSLTAVSTISATTMAPYSCAGMFKGCTSLVTAPALPATTLAACCYGSLGAGGAQYAGNNSADGMFEGCTSLTTAPELPATTLANWCYSGMFKGCTSLTTTPNLPATTLVQACYQEMFSGCSNLTQVGTISATTLANYCYRSMFMGCTSLTQAPTLPITTLSDYCYYGMFEGCTSLTSLPTLSATTLAAGCYKTMFSGCTNLVNVPTNYLPVTTLASSCYAGMFKNCTSLIQAPTLPATTLANSCYGSNDSGGAPNGMNGMFSGCTSLTTAPNLPATTLANYCYCAMFYGCTSLTTAPELLATTLAQGCYQYMFNGCTNLAQIKMLGTSVFVNGTNCLNYWTSGVSNSGTFIMNSEARWYVTGNSGIPSSWTLQFDGNSTVAEDYINDISTGYLCFEAIEDGTFTLTIPSYVGTSYITSISYSLDERQTWITRANVSNSVVTITTPTVQAGNKIYWKGVGSKFCANYTSATSYRSTFSSTGRFNISGYIMSLLNGDGDYVDLTASINSYAFSFLFQNTKVVSTEYLKLPKTTNSYCYYYMFSGCTSLTKAPVLPATALSTYCYAYMFYSCTSLTTTPTLPATTLVSYCYNYMFNNCSNLNYVKALFTTTPGTSYTQYWLSGVKSSGTFVKHTNATWTTTGASGVPSGWTIERASE